MKEIEYKNFVKKDQKILFIAPGIFLTFGGMFEYVKMWFNETKKYSTDAKFLLKTNLNFPQKQNITSKILTSDSSIKKIVFTSILNLLFPSKILGKYFYKDYNIEVEKVDIVHVLSASLNNYALFKWLLNTYPRKKIIYTLHDPKPHTEKISFIARILRNNGNNGIFKLAERNKNFIIHLHSSQLIKDLPKKVKRVIIHPHPLLETRAERKRKNNSIIRLGFMGRIENYKGLSLFFEALKQLPKKLHSNIEVFIIGRGNIVNNWSDLPFKTVVKNELVTDEEFHQNMADLDCLVLPYINASQTGVGYMGVAYKIPMILSDIGGLPDVYRLCKTGKSILIKPNNKESLKQGIEKFINSNN
tara:strand:- start:65 stop:1141 length:1077 start_codon:yes stop_codon:yes gene_type:complete